MYQQPLHYQADTTECHGYVAHQDNSKRPTIIVIHDWSGQNELARQKANELAQMGYVGFAVDLYGAGKTGTTNDEKQQLMTPLMEARTTLLQGRLQSSFNAISKLDVVDQQNIAVIGFCFGGLCALDLARSGVALKGAVSFHGFLNAPEKSLSAHIKAKLLALHGYADPMIPPQQITDFATEMTTANVDWQIHAYGNVQHAFTNPQAHDDKLGLHYNQTAANRAWLAMQNFLTEIFI